MPRLEKWKNDGLKGNLEPPELVAKQTQGVLKSAHYHDSRCHLALNKDSPEPREVQSPDKGRIVEIPKVGGLHHRYERRAA
jgi:hypothetical protein